MTGCGMKKKIAINIGSNWAYLFVNVVVGIGLVPFMIARLGMVDYGIWVLLSQILAYVVILNNGLTLAMNRFSAYYRNDIQQLNRFISASFGILMIVAILLLLAGFFLSLYLSYVFKIPADILPQAKTTCILVGLTLAVATIGATFAGVLKGFQYYARYNTIQIIVVILRAGAVVLALYFWPGIVSLQITFFFASLLSTILMVIVAKKSIPQIKLLAKTDIATVGELFRYSKHSIARSGSDIAMYTTMTLLVGWMGTPTDVTIYSLASKIPQYYRSFLTSAQSVFLPAITEIYASDGLRRVRALVAKAIRLSAILTGVSSILLLIYTEWILRLWLGESYRPEISTIMRLVIISIIPRGIFEIWMPALVALGILRGLTFSAIFTALSAIVLGFFFASFVPVPLAPALALVVALTARSGLWLPFYGMKKTRIQSGHCLQLSPYT